MPSSEADLDIKTPPGGAADGVHVATPTATANFSPQVIYVLVLLAVLMGLSQIDRQLLSVFAEPIRKDLHLSDTRLGLLTGLGFAVCYTLCGIPLARLADRMNRGRLLTACLVVWSAATMVSGGAQNFIQLLSARLGVAVGEAGGQPASHSLIADYVPVERRGTAFGWYSIGGAVGSMLAYFVGGFLGERIGWRATTVLVGLAGLPVAAVIWLTLRDPRPPVARGEAAPASGRSIFADVGVLFSRPSYVVLVATLVFCMIPSYAINAWAPAYFMRSRGLSIGQVGLWVGLTSGAAYALGTVLSGFLGDWGARRGQPMLPAAICTILAGPVFTLTFFAPSATSALGLFFLALTLASMWYAPAFAAIQAVAPTAMRSQASAVALFFTSLFGVGVSPTLTGVLSDAFRPAYGEESLKVALLVMANTTLLGGVSAWLAGRAMSQRWPFRAGPAAPATDA